MSMLGDALPPQRKRRLGVRMSLAILMMVYTLNFLDRQIINILAESIKRDLDISDTELGLLTGLSFALVYGLLGLPVARIAERVHRPRLIAVSLVAWSGFTALSGMSQNFWQLAAARFGIGVGEAGGSPSAYALISDLVPREKRSLAISIYSAGYPLGTLLGLVIGGTVADRFGWRAAFMLVGLPGIMLAAVVALGLSEPRQRVAEGGARPERFGRVALRLLGNQSYILVCLGAGLLAMTTYGQQAFITPFFLRSHSDGIQDLAKALQPGTGRLLGPLSIIGIFFGVTHGLAAITGTVMGGWLADRWAARRPSAHLLVPVAGALTSIPLLLLALQTTDYVWCTLLMIAPGVTLALSVGPLPAAVQGLVAPLSRATASAIFLLTIAVVGVGLGPVYVGVVSDLFAKSGLDSATALRWSLMTAELPAFLGSCLLWLASRRFAQELVS